MNNEIINKIKELDVQYIIFKGYYTNKDDGHELHDHTPETLLLYNKGLDMFPVTEENNDTFNGVCFDENFKPLAEWQIDGVEKYYEIDLEVIGNIEEKLREDINRCLTHFFSGHRIHEDFIEDIVEDVKLTSDFENTGGYAQDDIKIAIQRKLIELIDNRY